MSQQSSVGHGDKKSVSDGSLTTEGNRDGTLVGWMEMMGNDECLVAFSNLDAGLESAESYDSDDAGFYEEVEWDTDHENLMQRGYKDAEEYLAELEEKEEQKDQEEVDNSVMEDRSDKCE